MRYSEPPALLSLACMFGEALKTSEKESYDSKIEINDIGIPNTPPPSKISPKSLPKILIILS